MFAGRLSETLFETVQLIKRAALMALICFVALFSLSAFAQVVLPPAMSDSDFIVYVVNSIIGMKGASIISICTLAFQILFKFAGTAFGDKLYGKHKLTVVAIASLGIAICVALPTTGFSLASLVIVLTAGPVLFAFQVAFHQIKEQYFTEKGEKK